MRKMASGKPSAVRGSVSTKGLFDDDFESQGRNALVANLSKPNNLVSMIPRASRSHLLLTDRVCWQSGQVRSTCIGFKREHGDRRRM
jgi:hypothetical protein